MALLSLFLSAFTSATLLPGSSEALFLLMLSQDLWNTPLLILIAGTGNSLGGMSNWLLGFLIRKGIWRTGHPISKKNDFKDNDLKNKHHIRAEKWMKQYGSPVLLLSFLPIIGDPLCVVAGLIKIHWLKAIIFISIGKFMRYFALSALI